MQAVGSSSQTLSLVMAALFLCAILLVTGLIARATTHTFLRVATFILAMGCLLFISGALMFETGIMLNWMSGDMTHAWEAGLIIFAFNLLLAGLIWAFVLGVIFWRYRGKT